MNLHVRPSFKVLPRQTVGLFLGPAVFVLLIATGPLFVGLIAPLGA